MSKARRALAALCFAALSVTAVVSGCGSTSTVSTAAGSLGAYYPRYNTEAKLVADVDVVVVGEVIKSETRDIDINPGGEQPLVLPYLVSTVKVQRVIKGAVSPGDSLEVKQLLAADQPDFQRLDKKGSRALLFLAAYPNSPYSPANPDQGVVLIENGRARGADGNQLFKGGKSEADVTAELGELAK
jgi:hypothetical protein